MYLYASVVHVTSSHLNVLHDVVLHDVVIQLCRLHSAHLAYGCKLNIDHYIETSYELVPFRQIENLL